jgi:8-oxo-dGTP pyrophosphatase MutT (NUDIX family)
VPTPDFVLALREKIGHDPLPLPGVTAVVFDDAGRVLLGRRSDNGRWSLITGCLEPGEQPAVGLVREIEEETGVVAVAERLVSVTALPMMACANGDLVHWLDLTFRCRAVGGDARVNDDESLEVGWFDRLTLPDLRDRDLQCIADAAAPGEAARFRTV